MEHDIVRGLADLTTAIKLRPDADLGTYYSERGSLYEAGDQLDAALADYQKGLELSTTPALKGYVKDDIAGVYGKKGENDLALSAASDAVQLLPDRPFVYRDRADIYIKMGKFDLPLADLKKTAELDAKNPK